VANGDENRRCYAFKAKLHYTSFPVASL